MENLTTFFDMLYAPQAWFLHLSPYISMTITGVVIAALIGLAGFILARMGYKPLWALALLVPYAGVIAVWALAYRRFPRELIKQEPDR